MKKIILIASGLLFTIVIYAQPFYYTVKSTKNNGLAGSYLYIRYEAGSDIFIDSFLLANKEQVFKRKVPQPVAATFYSGDKSIKPFNVFIAKTNLVLDKKNIRINDKNDLQNLYLQLTKNDRIRPTYFPLYGELNAKNDTAGLKKLSIIFDSLRSDDIATSKKYLEESGNSLLSLFAFMRFASFSADYAAAEPYFLQLPEWARESADGKNSALKISSAKSVQVNTKAPFFESSTLSGEPVNLKNYNGKFLLIDFWASWCGPCRKEHPALKELYSEYSNKNFEIISISLDDKKENWSAATEKDKLPWTNISELKGFQASAALVYGVQAIPANFLVDPHGIIIAKNSSPQELRILLKKILP